MTSQNNDHDTPAGARQACDTTLGSQASSGSSSAPPPSGPGRRDGNILDRLFSPSRGRAAERPAPSGLAYEALSTSASPAAFEQEVPAAAPINDEMDRTVRAEDDAAERGGDDGHGAHGNGGNDDDDDAQQGNSTDNINVNAEEIYQAFQAVIGMIQKLDERVGGRAAASASSPAAVESGASVSASDEAAFRKEAIPRRRHLRDVDADRTHGWMQHEKDALTFMYGSNDDALRDHKTHVTVAEVGGRTPKSKVEIKNYIAHTASPDKLLIAFQDELTHHEFVDVRRDLVVKLAVVANLQDDSVTGLQAATRLLDDALANVKPKFGGRDYSRLLLINDIRMTHNRQGDIMPIVKALAEFDHEFAKLTAVERNLELQQALNRVTVLTTTPSGMIPKVTSLYQQIYASVPDDDTRAALVDRNVRNFMLEQIKDGSDGHDWLMPFATKLTDTDFVGKDLSEWARQFKHFEAQSSFKRGRAAASSQPAPAAPSVRGSRPAGRVNAITNDDDDEASSSADQFKLNFASLQRQLTHMQDQIATINGGTTGGAAPAPKWDSPQWVALYGVVGFPPPGDQSRKDIMVGEIWRQAGVPIPPGCPKDPGAFVGSLCPCNHIRQIPPAQWYWHPHSKEYKDGDNRKPSPGAPPSSYAYMHRLGKCVHAYKHGHLLGRADPTKAHLLDPLPPGCTDCIGGD